MDLSVGEQKLWNCLPANEASCSTMRERSLATFCQMRDKDPNNLQKNYTLEFDYAALEEKRLRKIKPVQREVLSENPSLNLKCPGPFLKRPFTLAAVRIDGIAKVRIEGSSEKSRKKSNSANGGRLQKKLRQTVIDHIKKDFLKSDIVINSRKSDNFFLKVTENAENERSRFEEIEKRKRRITKLILCAEKSLTSVFKKRRDKNCFTNANNSNSLLSDVKKTTKGISCERKQAEVTENKFIFEKDLTTDEKNNNVVEISLVEVRKTFSPLSSFHGANVEEIVNSGALSPSVTTISAEELTYEEEITVRQELKEYDRSNVCLRNYMTEETGKEQLSCDLKKEIKAVSETLISTNISLKGMEKMFFEKGSTIDQLWSYVSKLQGLSGALKEKDDLIMDLESQNFDLKSENNRIIKELNRLCTEQQNRNNEKERLMILISELKEKEDNIKSKISEMSGKIIEKEKELTYVQNIFGDERIELKKKHDADLSAKMENLSGQLAEKDAIIRELKTLRDSVQLINREVCSMLASVFKEFGRQRSETEIESLISSGRSLALKDSLISMIEKTGEKGTEAYDHEACMEVISSLEDRTAVLEAELEESRNYAETLVGLISTGHHLGGEQEGLMKLVGHATGRSDKENATCRNFRHCLATSDLPQNFCELFTLLEVKRQALMQTEKKVQDLEEVHSRCNYKRVRNETRIENLEMELAAVKSPKLKRLFFHSS